MKCPLLGTMRTVGHGELHPVFADCVEGKCAWWDKSTTGCAVLEIVMALGTIDYSLKGVIKND